LHLVEQAAAKRDVIFGGPRRLEIFEVFGQPLERPCPPSSIFGVWKIVALVKNGALDGREFVSLLPSGGRPSVVTVRKHLEG
jgi:hypothetical protein